MLPEEYELCIAKYYSDLGYQVELTKKSHDYGVDVVVRKGSESIAIQAKKYDVGSRQASYKDIMYLFAGKTIYKCNDAILITSGLVANEAKEVADKLNIKVIEKWSPEKEMVTKKDVGSQINREIGYQEDQISEYPSFQEAWLKYIVPLKGKTIQTITGLENQIVDVNMNYVERISSNGNRSRIEIGIFRECYNYLIVNGELTRKHINELYIKRASAIIFVLLSEIPFFDIRLGLTPTLVLKRK